MPSVRIDVPSGSPDVDDKTPTRPESTALTSRPTADRRPPPADPMRWLVSSFIGLSDRPTWRRTLRW